MWLAVLFVALFGDNMAFAGNNGPTSIPSAVAVALFAMFATIAVAHTALATPSVSDEMRVELEEERHAVERLSEEVSQLRAKLVP
jgi:hypothetical protein